MADEEYLAEPDEADLDEADLDETDPDEAGAERVEAELDESGLDGEAFQRLLDVVAAWYAGRPPEGRPSLHGGPGTSPKLAARVSPDLMARAEVAAARRRTSVSVLVRQGLEELLDRLEGDQRRRAPIQRRRGAGRIP